MMVVGELIHATVYDSVIARAGRHADGTPVREIIFWRESTRETVTFYLTSAAVPELLEQMRKLKEYD